ALRAPALCLARLSPRRPSVRAACVDAGLAAHHRHKTPSGMLAPSTSHAQDVGNGRALANTPLFGPQPMGETACGNPAFAGKSLHSGGGPDGVIGSAAPPGWMMMRMACASVKKV